MNICFNRIPKKDISTHAIALLEEKVAGVNNLLEIFVLDPHTVWPFFFSISRFLVRMPIFFSSSLSTIFFLFGIIDFQLVRCKLNVLTHSRNTLEQDDTFWWDRADCHRNGLGKRIVILCLPIVIVVAFVVSHINCDLCFLRSRPLRSQ